MVSWIVTTARCPGNNGKNVYTLGEKGLMASADVSGTRFWVDEELNPRTDYHVKETQSGGRIGTEFQDGSSGR